MPQENPKKKEETKKALKAPVAKTNRDLSIGAKTGVDLNKPVNYNSDPTQIPIGANPGSWATFQRYAKDYKFNNGDNVKGNIDMNSAEFKTMYTDKLISDFNMSPEAAKYKAKITSKDIKDIQAYHKLTDPKVPVDGWFGSLTSKLYYPQYKTAISEDVKSGANTKGYIPYQWGNKEYVLPASKQGSFSKEDLVPYDPNIHGLELQRGASTAGRFNYTPTTTVTPTPIIAPTTTVMPIQKKAKGGIVNKVKGYYVGGLTGDEDNYLTTNPNFNSGVVGQNDPYAAQKAKDKEISDAKKKKNEANARATANAAGKALGGYGSAYYNSQTPTSKGDATRSATLSAVSQSGAIGGAIGGIAAIGDKIGKPIKARTETVNSSTGELNNERSTKNKAALGIMFSPSKRTTYEGGMTDVTGKAYINSIENKTRSQLQEVKDANFKSVQQQTIANRNANDLNAVTKKPYDLNGATFDDNHQLVLANGQQFDKNRPMMNKGGLVGKIKQMCADGGEIKGKGGPKEDKIEAEVEEGSFVVPAKNAELAKGIRKLYLKAPNKKANLNQKKGEEVKLSNGEHLFTPEENEYLESIGVDLEALAPEAEKESDEMAKGGKVDGDPLLVSKADINKSFEAKKSKDIADRKVLKAKIKQAESNPNTSKLFLQTLKDKVKSIDEAYGVEDNETEIKKPYTAKTSDKIATTPKVGSKLKATKIKETPEQMAQRGSALEGLKKDAELRGLNNIAEADNQISTTPIKEAPQVDYKKSSAKKGWAERIGNVDPTSFIGIGQTALGLNMLKGEKRPIDRAVIGPTYNANVERSIQDARFGLTPEQRVAADQDIQNSLNDAKFQGLNYAGGSGVQAFNTNRAAINDAWKAKLGLKEADTNLRMQKQQYADAQVANRANILAANRRMLFNDAMNTFQQKQQAGGDLISAGLSNTIGAYRFRQDRKAWEEAEAERNGFTKNI